MEKQSVRVVIASEYPRTRSFLRQIIEQENGVEIVGQAQDAGKALTLTRKLRPDVVVLDCYLPYSVSPYPVPLSRISGLDTARAIYEEVPRAKIMLLNNLDNSFPLDNIPAPGAAGYCMGSGGKCILIAQWSLSRAVNNSNEPFFANVILQEPETSKRKAASLYDELVLFGALGFAGGLLLIISVFLAIIGAPLAIIGALTVIIGLTGKLIASFWRKTRGRLRSA